MGAWIETRLEEDEQEAAHLAGVAPAWVRGLKQMRPIHLSTAL